MAYFGRASSAGEETRKKTATEKMNFKITTAEMTTYAEKQRMPTLKELADIFCDDTDFDKITEKTEVGSLTKISNDNPTAIIAKLKAYPYEFEINSSLQLASIDGIKVATVPINDEDSIVSMTKAELQDLIDTSISSKMNNYSTYEQVVGTWTDGKPIYQKTYSLSASVKLNANSENVLASYDNTIAKLIDCEVYTPYGDVVKPTYFANNSSNGIFCYIAIPSMTTGTQWSNCNCFTIRYIKTTPTVTHE